MVRCLRRLVCLGCLGAGCLGAGCSVLPANRECEFVSQQFDGIEHVKSAQLECAAAVLAGDGIRARVEMADGRTGHVRTDSIRSPIDYRALFVPEDGRWRLKVFIAGD